nr:D-beta-hydroxybutyrate dehydrogenase [uncultured bacterium]
MLKDKAVIVTGSTSGIGKGILQAFAAEGCKLVMNGLEPVAKVEELRASLAESYGVEVLYHGADMSQPEQISSLIEQTKKAFGSIDIIVNNAGIQHVAPVDEFPIDKWDAILAVNLSSAFHMTRLAVPHMKAAGWGRIINLASAHALVASPFKSAYVAAKHGMAGLTKVVALELAQENITCNAICPGYVKTPLVENQIADTAKARAISEEEVVNEVMLKAQPTKKFTQVEDLGAMAVFLCSEAAANMTGTMLSVDGGWVAQ